MSGIKLKPCPFCGCKAELFQDYMGWFVVECAVCGNGTLHFAKSDGAVNAWNRRADTNDP